MQADNPLAVNDKDFLEIVSEVFCDWITQLSSVRLQAVWAGIYVVSIHCKMYIDQLMGCPVPAYFSRLSLEGDGIKETAFK